MLYEGEAHSYPLHVPHILMCARERWALDRLATTSIGRSEVGTHVNNQMRALTYKLPVM